MHGNQARPIHVPHHSWRACHARNVVASHKPTADLKPLELHPKHTPAHGMPSQTHAAPGTIPIRPAAPLTVFAASRR